MWIIRTTTIGVGIIKISIYVDVLWLACACVNSCVFLLYSFAVKKNQITQNNQVSLKFLWISNEKQFLTPHFKCKVRVIKNKSCVVLLKKKQTYSYIK